MERGLSRERSCIVVFFEVHPWDLGVPEALESEVLFLNLLAFTALAFLLACSLACVVAAICNRTGQEYLG